ncbi:MAG: sodium ion-translocating decarboxylase subunit beta [Magnetococcales bacterium]|nr:sodium ion-translocating decarboxylase subunit beta [Magnetococcales bacterium]
MSEFNFLDLFQGIATLVHSFETQPEIALMRIFLIFLGGLLMYLGYKGVLEALLMIPMGLGMATVNAAVMFVPESMSVPSQGGLGTLFLNPLISEGKQLMDILQIDWLQPVYVFTFSNGLIACLVFLGIGTVLDVGFLMVKPFQSMFLAVCAELGTLITFPLGTAFGLTVKQAAATSTIGGADGPMILFASLTLAKDLFVPITVVAYLYLGLTYGGYPYLIKALVPERFRAIPMPPVSTKHITPGQKMVFAAVVCVLLSLLFPIAGPLFFCVFMGVIIRESGLKEFNAFFSGPVLYGATFFLGLILGILCEASTLLDEQVFILLVLGITALTLSAIGGLLGGYFLYWWTGGKFNPVIGIAAVSCVPTTAKVAQKVVSAANPSAIVLPDALGANISGVITSAILAAALISIVGGGMGG